MKKLKGCVMLVTLLSVVLGFTHIAKAALGDIVAKGIVYVVNTYDGHGSTANSYWNNGNDYMVCDINFANDDGKPVYAPENGSVTYNTSSSGNKGLIWTSADGREKIRVSHLSAFEGSARTVKSGDVMGYVGSTGNSTGPHMHVERLYDGRPAMVVLSGVTLNPQKVSSGYGTVGAKYTSKGPLPASVKVTNILIETATYYPVFSWARYRDEAALQLSAQVLPDNATNKAVTWSSSNTSVATVNSTGLVTYKGLGTTEIRATAQDGSGVYDIQKINIADKPVVSSVTPNTLNASLGETITWTAVGYGGYNYYDSYAYNFKLYRNGALLKETGYGASKTFAYTPTSAGSYFVEASFKDYFSRSPNVRSASTAVSEKSNTVPSVQITKVEVLSGSSLKVIWSGATGVSGYEVWWNTASTGTYRLAKSTTATSFTKTYLQPGIRYFFKVRAYKLDGTKKVFGPFSAAKIGIPLAKPVISSATATGVDRVKLVIAPVAGATGYRIYTSATAAGTYKLKLTTTASTVTVTGLKPETTCYFKVQAYKRIYTTNYYGPMSGYKGAKTLALAKAVISSATATGTDRVKLVISPVTGASGYRIFRSLSSAGPYDLAMSTTSSKPTVTGLKPNTQYYFKVQAYKRIYSTNYYGPMSGYKGCECQLESEPFAEL